MLTCTDRVCSLCTLPTFFPGTETVYGLGANALNETAAKKIFQFKGRPPTGTPFPRATQTHIHTLSVIALVQPLAQRCTHPEPPPFLLPPGRFRHPQTCTVLMPDPLIVHVLSLEAALDLVELTPDETRLYRALAERFWPGPLTIIAKAKPIIPSAITAGTGFVGVRSPAHPTARRLLEAVSP